VGKPEGKRPLGRQFEDGGMGSEWILGRLVGGGVDWIRLAQDRDQWRAVVSAVMNLRVLATELIFGDEFKLCVMFSLRYTLRS
jgi:hypothetical protein